MSVSTTRRQAIGSCRAALAPARASASSAAEEPGHELARRDVLRHLAEAAAEHGVRVFGARALVSSRLVIRLGGVRR
jgi:hypothetical protein